MILDSQTILSAYAHGAFPMADPDGRLGWYTADPRGVFPLDQFHIPSSLAQTLRQRKFEIRFNTAFEETMRACMSQRAGETWICEPLIQAFCGLHREGFAHSVEAWRGGELAGGLYGLALGGAFMGESMFHRQRDASKAALAGLVERLRQRGFVLLDAQARTAHLARMGCVEISARDYLQQLRAALPLERRFD